MKKSVIRNIALIGVGAVCGLGTMVCTTSCSEKQWEVEGTVAGGEGKELVLEAPNHYGRWYPVDTVTVGSNGSFSVKGDPIGHPEVYRLTMGGQSVYFPIDSIEHVTIAADAAKFGTSYTVSGSESADKLQTANELIAKAVAKGGEESVGYDPELKRSLAELILRDPAGIVAYYTIFRSVGKTPLFDPTQKSDLRMIGAVANAYHRDRPADPRTAYLEQYYLSNRKVTGAYVPADTIMAEQVSLPEIALLDRDGKRRSLNEEASKGKVVVLNFTAYSAQESTPFNMELAKVYKARKDAGLEIYQVSLDGDEFQWRESARNLPWITVYNSPKDGGETLMRYNVTALPATFVINRKGELVERIDDVTKLDAAVARYQ